MGIFRRKAIEDNWVDPLSNVSGSSGTSTDPELAQGNSVDGAPGGESTIASGSFVGVVGGLLSPPPVVNPSADDVAVRVEILEAGPQKIRDIKTIRDNTGMSLGDTKALIESVPVFIPNFIARTQAEALVRGLAEYGTKAVIHD